LPPLYGVETLPGYDLTFSCAGRTFKAFVRARNVQAASHEAMIELAAQCPDFDPEDARLHSAAQTW
jgi:hypothetical protein